MINIINSLREIDINKRWDSERLLENVKEIYFKTYMKNTSITSILRCLYAYPDLNDKIFRKKDTIKNNRDKYYLQYKYIKITSIIAGFEEGELNEKINEFRFDISLSWQSFNPYRNVSRNSPQTVICSTVSLAMERKRPGKVQRPLYAR